MPVKKLTDGTAYDKATYWDGEVLKGKWHVTFKIDGVRAIRNSSGAVVSRNSKPLYNLDRLQFDDAEIFRADWNTSISLVRTESPTDVCQDDVYELSSGRIDSRLDIGYITNPTTGWLERMLRQALGLGYEGLVLRGTSARGLTVWKKVVPKIYADIRVTGWYLGKTGSNIGKLGGFTTNWGNIGGGYSKEFRAQEHYVFDEIVDNRAIMQVGYREMTKKNKLRFAAFDRWRWDKDEESIQWDIK